MKIGTLAVVVVAAVFAFGGAKADTFEVTVEPPAVQSSTAKLGIKGVETFNEQSVGLGDTFTTGFGTDRAITGRCQTKYHGASRHGSSMR
jgi:hypothetical protein